jgi:hypothetical protein
MEQRRREDDKEEADRKDLDFLELAWTSYKDSVRRDAPGIHTNDSPMIVLMPAMLG